MLISSTTRADDVQQTFNEVKCLTQNIYHEARDQSYEGKIAVAQVTLNRVRSGLFPDSICKVVYQPNQFSWTRYKPKILEKDKYFEIYELAFDQYLNYTDNDDSVYYHTLYVKPSWSKSKKKTKIVGRHIFYKEK